MRPRTRNKHCVYLFFAQGPFMVCRQIGFQPQEGTVNRTIIAVATVLFSMMVFGSPASALGKPATGSNCSSDWVNNSGAMECFTKGEDESRAGAAHPHYVACLNGQIYCCHDDSKGQNCDAVMDAGRSTSKDWMKAVLAAHRAQAVRMSRMPTNATTPPHSRQP